jgi:hypothetical protein
MFKWLRETAEKKIIQSHLSEMIPWLRKLNSIPDEDVGAIYLAALVFRNITKKHEGIDLIKTEDALEKHPMLPVRIGNQIRDAQMSSLSVSANGMKVWLFTIRSVMHDELRPVGLAIWRELPRGFPYVQKISAEMLDKSGTRTDLTDFGQVPVGFESRDAGQPRPS